MCAMQNLKSLFAMNTDSIGFFCRYFLETNQGTNVYYSDIARLTKPLRIPVDVFLFFLLYFSYFLFYIASLSAAAMVD